MAKRPLKEGTVVRINDKKWYNKLPKDKEGIVDGTVIRYGFTPEMAAYCGKKAKIAYWYHGDSYTLDIDGGLHIWTPQMFKA